MARQPALDLRMLGVPPGLPALTPAMGMAYAEAAAVCFDYHGHRPGTRVNVLGIKKCTYPVKFPEVTEQIKRSHNDLGYATEDGAYAMAICLAMEITGTTVILQSRKGTGFDYWLGESDDSLFQNKSRLEVSGILDGDDSKIGARVREKQRQTRRSDATGLPAYVCVVEFGKPESYFTKR